MFFIDLVLRLEVEVFGLRSLYYSQELFLFLI